MLSAEEREDSPPLDTVGDVEAVDHECNDGVLGIFDPPLAIFDPPRTVLANTHTDEVVKLVPAASDQPFNSLDSCIRSGLPDSRGIAAYALCADFKALDNQFHDVVGYLKHGKDKDERKEEWTEMRRNDQTTREEQVSAEEPAPPSDPNNAYSPSELKFQEDESVLSSVRNAYGTRSLQVQDELEKLKKEGMVTLSYGDHGIGSQNRIFRIHSNCWPAVINRLDASITSKDKQKNNKEGTPSENLAQTFRYCGVIPKKDPAKKKRDWKNPYEGIYEFCVEARSKTLERIKSQNGKNKTAKRKRPETSSTSMSARRGRGSKRQRTTPPASKKPAQPAAAPATSFLVSPLTPAPDAASDFADRCLNLDSE